MTPLGASGGILNKIFGNVNSEIRHFTSALASSATLATRRAFYKCAGCSVMRQPEDGIVAFSTRMSWDHVHQFGRRQRIGVVMARLHNLALMLPISGSIGEGPPAHQGCWPRQSETLL